MTFTELETNKNINGDNILTDNTGFEVAVVFVNEGNNGEAYTELFKAAPGLRKAAWKALQELEIWGESYPDDEGMQAAITALREAINQAEGKDVNHG